MFIKGSKLAGKIDETSIIRAAESTYYSKISQLPTTIDQNGPQYKIANKEARMEAAMIFADHGYLEQFKSSVIDAIKVGQELSFVEKSRIVVALNRLETSSTTSRAATAAISTPIPKDQVETEFSRVFSIN